MAKSDATDKGFTPLPPYQTDYDAIARRQIREALRLADTHSPVPSDFHRRDGMRAGTGVIALEEVLRFLMEVYGYDRREAMDTLVLEAVRVASVADRNRKVWP